MNLQSRIEALVKAAVGLAIVRHSLVTEDGTMDDDTRESICADAWQAVRGEETCSGECPEWDAVRQAVSGL